MRVCVALVTIAACTPNAPTEALFVVPGEGVADDFYALPFPNDLRRKDDGTLDLSAFPTTSLIVESYRAAAEQLDGFGLNQPIFARFANELDNASLPDPAASITETASVYLVDVDPDSPARGTRSPIAVRYRGTGTETLGSHSIVARPYPGFGLVDGTTYALVITNRVHDAYGDPILASAMFTELMAPSGGSPGIAHAREVYQPLLDWLDEAGGDARGDVVSAAVFTTQHATAILPAIRKGVYAAAAPVATEVVKNLDAPTIKKFAGSYQAPNFQRGVVPYHEGGDIVVGSDGAAIVQRTETMRFALTVPTTPMPANGYPIVIYSHGTGGDYESFFSDGTGIRLADQGLATISTDQVLHGPRNPGGDAEIDFFNFSNPYAARDNALQGAADAFSQHRLAAALMIADGTPIKFDPSKIYFFGHSQGGVTGPGYVAFEPTLTGAVFSGTAGLLTLALLNKTKPLDIPGLLGALLRDDPVDVDNPSIGLVQMWMERADPINYAPLMVRRPATAPDGTPLQPRNIFQTEGFTDNYSPNPGIEAFAVALGADLAMVPDHKDILGVTLRGGTTRATPITDNAGSVTCVLAQYKQAGASDGHYVVFDVPLAKQQAVQFLTTLARTGKATVVSPQ